MTLTLLNAADGPHLAQVLLLLGVHSAGITHACALVPSPGSASALCGTAVGTLLHLPLLRICICNHYLCTPPARVLWCGRLVVICICICSSMVTGEMLCSLLLGECSCRKSTLKGFICRLSALSQDCRSIRLALVISELPS